MAGALESKVADQVFLIVSFSLFLSIGLNVFEIGKLQGGTERPSEHKF